MVCTIAFKNKFKTAVIDDFVSKGTQSTKPLHWPLEDKQNGTKFKANQATLMLKLEYKFCQALQFAGI